MFLVGKMYGFPLPNLIHLIRNIFHKKRTSKPNNSPRSWIVCWDPEDISNRFPRKLKVKSFEDISYKLRSPHRPVVHSDCRPNCVRWKQFGQLDFINFLIFKNGNINTPQSSSAPYLINLKKMIKRNKTLRKQGQDTKEKLMILRQHKSWDNFFPTSV